MSEWKTKSLGEITSYIAKGIPPKYAEKATDDTVVVLNQKCNRDYRISYGDSRLHDNLRKKVPEIKMLNPGDVLINSTGTGTAGRIAQIWKIEKPTTIDGHMIVIRPTDEIDPLYYGYAVKSFQAAIESYAEGSTGQTEINKTRLQNETFITYPVDKSEQFKIARLLADLDEKILLNEEINDNLQQQVQLLYEDFIATIDEISIAMSEIIDVRDGTHDSPKPLEFGFPMVTSKHLLPFGVDIISPNKISESDYNKINERSKVDKSDILLSMIGTVGLVSLIIEDEVNFAIKNVGLFKTSKCPQYTYYLLCYLKSKETIQYIEKHLAGSTQKYISLTELRKMPIVIPNTIDINKFNDLVTPLFSLIIKNIKENQALIAIRDSLLPKLMSGELDVSEIDI